MQKIVISGGTGFIGRAAVAALVSRGDHVTVLTRDPERARRAGPAAAHFERGALSSDPPTPAVAGSHAVIHLAGERAVGTRWSEKVKREIIESRVRSTERLGGGVGGAQQ